MPIVCCMVRAQASKLTNFVGVAVVNTAAIDIIVVVDGPLSTAFTVIFPALLSTLFLQRVISLWMCLILGKHKPRSNIHGCICLVISNLFVRLLW